VLGPVSHQIAANTAEVFTEFFPELAQLPFAEESLRAIHAMFAGLVLSSMAVEGDDHGDEVREFLKILVSLSEQLVPLLPTVASRSRS
jgi:hypothetical protein